MNGQVSNVSALVLPVADDDRRPEKEWFELLRLQAEALRDATELSRELIQNTLEARRQERDELSQRQERRFREVVRDVIQEHMFDSALSKSVTRKPADRPSRKGSHASYTAEEFDTKLRVAIKTLCDPDEMDRLTVKKVLAFVNVSPNTFRDLLKDYGYSQPSETPAKCLQRMADEWHPEWRGINRQRF